jgi:hypothetical protein
VTRPEARDPAPATHGVAPTVPEPLPVGPMANPEVRRVLLRLRTPPRTGWLLRGGGYLGLVAIATFLWIWCAVQVATVLAVLTHPPLLIWLYDWNVYHAAAGQLVDRTLYRVPLVEPGFSLPLPVFNYPPLAAVWVLPLLPLGREAGGIAFEFLSLGCLAAGLMFAVRALGLRYPWAWAAGILALWLATFPYLAMFPYVVAEIGLGNNNELMFLLVSGFTVTHLAGHQRVAGLLLGLAIATKVWPVALVVLLLREKRWSELRWAAGFVAIQGVLILAWLGPDVLPNLIHAVFFANGPRNYPDVPALWTTTARNNWSWWPWWGTYAVAVLFAAIPARGRIGLGLAIIAGLSLNANLWFHYDWAFYLGWALVVVGLGRQVRSLRPPARPSWSFARSASTTGRGADKRRVSAPQ